MIPRGWQSENQASLQMKSLGNLSYLISGIERVHEKQIRGGQIFAQDIK